VSFEGVCGRIAIYPLANLRAHPGALPVNELKTVACNFLHWLKKYVEVYLSVIKSTVK
jgi:hypothetical protein